MVLDFYYGLPIVKIFHLSSCMKNFEIIDITIQVLGNISCKELDELLCIFGKLKKSSFSLLINLD